MINDDTLTAEACRRVEAVCGDETEMLHQMIAVCAGRLAAQKGALHVRVVCERIVARLDRQ